MGTSAQNPDKPEQTRAKPALPSTVLDTARSRLGGGTTTNCPDFASVLRRQKSQVRILPGALRKDRALPG
jgi:hypothetical protein